MTTIYDVPPDKLVKLTAEKLKTNKTISMPKWAMEVKKGANKELPPQDEDWWWVRCASVLRQIYIHGPVGVSRLRTYYGSRVRRGAKPERFRKASGKLIRGMLLQLEQAGYVINPETGRKGRVISSAGQKILDNAAHEIKEQKKEGEVLN